MGNQKYLLYSTWKSAQCSVAAWMWGSLGENAAAAAKSLQLYPTLCDPVDCSLPGSPVPGILQERTLEWVAISFSNAWKWKVKVKSLSCVRLLATPQTAAYQAPLSMGFSRQEYWSGVPLPSPKSWLHFPKESWWTWEGKNNYSFDAISLYSHLWKIIHKLLV